MSYKGRDEIIQRYIKVFSDYKESLTVRDIAERLGVSPWAVYRGIKKLIEKEYIEEFSVNAEGRGRPTKVFKLTPRGMRFLKAIEGEFEIEDVISVLRPTFKQLQKGDIIHSIAGLERFLNDNRRSNVARRVGLSLWLLIFIRHIAADLNLSNIQQLMEDVYVNIWKKNVPTILKARAFVGIVWITLPYITTIRRLLIVPDDILLAEEELVFYVSVHWYEIEKFISYYVFESV